MLRNFLGQVQVEVATAAELVRNHVILYSELTRNALEDGEWQYTGWHSWRFYPKHHMLVHLAETIIARAGCVKEFWCYRDENHIGRAVELARAVHIKHVSTSLIKTYRLQ